jgi:hypothetical protein
VRKRVRLLLLGVTLMALIGTLSYVARVPIAASLAQEDRMSWSSKVRHLLGGGLAAVLGHAAPAAAAVPPTSLGINLTPPLSYAATRNFANLAIGSDWLMSQPGQHYEKLPVDLVDPLGNIRALPAGAVAIRKLVRPDTGPAGAVIRCTFEGRGDVSVQGPVSSVSKKSGSIEFKWVNDWAAPRGVELVFRGAGPQTPVRNLDCREADMPRTARFAPSYIQSLRGFAVLRFMDWQQTNGNAPVTWATRHTPQSLNALGGDGIAVEDMVELAKLVNADAWFTVPWNADADYVERFARYVHDTMPAQRRIYVELSNEVWNTRFRAAKQAAEEGMAEKLSDKAWDAGTLRYAEKLTSVMKVWEKVFADNPRRLVRVAATQNGSAPKAEAILGYKDTAAHVDALATAPYFGNAISTTKPTPNLDAAFAMMPAQIEEAIARAERSKAVAVKYRKRFISYEGGQHIVLKDNVPLAQQIQRDPRMYKAYKTYIAAWRTRIGDLLTLFTDSGPIIKSGSWGMVEHSGQPASEAPKLRAVQEELGRR